MEIAKGKVKKILADFLGVEPEDIDDEAFLTEDLHMDPTMLTDFMEVLINEGFDTSKTNLAETETFLELAESLSLK